MTEHGSESIEQKVIDGGRTSRYDEKLRDLDQYGRQQPEKSRRTKRESPQTKRGSEGQEQQDVGHRLAEERHVRPEHRLADVAERPEPKLPLALLRKQRQEGDRGHRRSEGHVREDCEPGSTLLNRSDRLDAETIASPR